MAPGSVADAAGRAAGPHLQRRTAEALRRGDGEL